MVIGGEVQESAVLQPSPNSMALAQKGNESELDLENFVFKQTL